MKHFLHHLFIPRESNNHRPKVLHYEILFLLVAFLMSGLIMVAGVERQYPAVLGDATNISIQDLLTNTNMKRQANGLAPLKLNAQLNTAAEQKARHMFAQNYWAHVAPDGTTPWVFIKDSGYQYLYAGENLARGFNTGPEVVDAWMNSPTHKENMLSPYYTDIGFAVLPGTLTGSDTVLVVQMFGSPYTPKEEKTEQIATVPSGFAPRLQEPVLSGTPASVSATPIPTSIPTPTAVVAVGTVDQPTADAGVAAVQSQPLIDSSNLKRNTSFILLLFFIVILALDAIIIERKKIVRAFSHNLDHILFLAFILLAGIIIGKGAIL
jgi:hypothetical protein